MSEIKIKSLNFNEDDFKMNKKEFSSPSLRMHADTNHKTEQYDSTIFVDDKKKSSLENISA